MVLMTTASMEVILRSAEHLLFCATFFSLFDILKAELYRALNYMPGMVHNLIFLRTECDSHLTYFCLSFLI